MRKTVIFWKWICRVLTLGWVVGVENIIYAEDCKKNLSTDLAEERAYRYLVDHIYSEVGQELLNKTLGDWGHHQKIAAFQRGPKYTHIPSHKDSVLFSKVTLLPWPSQEKQLYLSEIPVTWYVWQMVMRGDMGGFDFEKANFPITGRHISKIWFFIKRVQHAYDHNHPLIEHLFGEMPAGLNFTLMLWTDYRSGLNAWEYAADEENLIQKQDYQDYHDFIKAYASVDFELSSFIVDEVKQFKPMRIGEHEFYDLIGNAFDYFILREDKGRKYCSTVFHPFSLNKKQSCWLQKTDHKSMAIDGFARRIGFRLAAIKR